MSEALITEIADLNPPLPRHVRDDEIVSLVRMADIKEGGGLISTINVPFDSVKLGLTRFAEGDVLFAKITPCMENGKGALATSLSSGIGCGSTEFHVLRAKNYGSAGFIYQVLQSKAFRQKAETHMSGSAGQQRVPSSFFRKHKIFLPQLSQQCRIAEILSTVDQTIGPTEALITKYQQIKAGLIRDLFTRGITPDGNLRPTRTQSPHLYKDSPIGWIPKSWECFPIGELFTRRAERGKAGLPVMSITMAGGLVKRDSVDRRVESNLSSEAHLLVRQGDITYNMMRMWQGVLGRAEYDCLVSPAYIVMKPGPNIESMFAEYLLSAETSIAWFKRLSYGVVDDRLRLYFRDLVRVPVTIPLSLPEQRAISERLQLIDSLIERTGISLAKLRYQKDGLMQDLLTGRVRVKGAESVSL
jgi:type I restriction enzyme, S subunit